MGDDLLKKTGSGPVTVEVRGLDVYDPTTGVVRSRPGVAPHLHVLVDHVSFEVIVREGLDGAFTLDSDFAAARIPVVPSP